MKEFTQEIETQPWKDSVSRIMPGALWPKIYDPQNRIFSIEKHVQPPPKIIIIRLSRCTAVLVSQRSTAN